VASSSDVIFPKSMADFLANPVDICFGSMPAESIAPTVCLVIEGVDTIFLTKQVKRD
jgi:hypothetical protein